jgi:hypothetical protein
MNTDSRRGHRSFWFTTLAAVMAASLMMGPVARASLEDAMAKFKAAVAREIKPGAKPPSDNRPAQLAMLLARLQTDIDNRQWKDAAGQLNFFGEHEKSPEMLQLIHELRLEVLKQSEAGENARISQIEATIKDASQVCSAATNPSDIDQVFRELSELRPPDEFQTERIRVACQKLNGALAFVVRWQDCLAKQLAGKPKDAAALIQTLLEDSKLYPLVDRSQLLAQMEKLKGTVPAETSAEARAETAAELIRRTDSLDGLDALSTQLEQRFAQKADKSTHALIQRISMLRAAYIDYRSGFYGSAFENCVAAPRSNPQDQAELLPLQEQLLIKLLPRYLNTDPSLVESSTNAWDCLMAIVGRAKEKHDWRLALHALETLHLVAFRLGPLPPWLAADIAGYSSLVAATNAEAAGLPAQAVTAYEKALASSGQNLPVGWIAERLKALRGSKADPKKRASG